MKQKARTDLLLMPANQMHMWLQRTQTGNFREQFEILEGVPVSDTGVSARILLVGDKDTVAK